MTHLGDLIQRWAERAMALALAVMVVMVFSNAAGRYLLGQGLSISEELSRLAFVWLIMIGAVVAVRERAHIGMDFVVLRLKPGVQRVCLVLSNLFILYALWLFATGGWKQTRIGLDSVLPVTGVPTAAYALAGLLAAIAMAALYALHTWRALTGRLADVELVQIRETAEDLPPSGSPAPEGKEPRP
jgi:TRAP-type C4-dicarboxylate transport system permease small subunit